MMNIYFLVEGRRTEKKVYPKWFSHLVPDLTRVNRYDEVNDGNYYLFSAEGYPSILKFIKPAVQEISDCGKYTHLAICLDADEVTVEERKKEVLRRFENDSLNMAAELVIIIQNRCFETWFLGNRKAFPRNPQDETFRSFCEFYDVSKKDPELMPAYPGFDSVSRFHEAYLKRMLNEKGVRYTKKNPGNVGEPTYVDALKKRVDLRPGDLQTLREFFSFCTRLNS